MPGSSTTVMDMGYSGKIICRETKKYIYCLNCFAVIALLHSHVHMDNCIYGNRKINTTGLLVLFDDSQAVSPAKDNV